MSKKTPTKRERLVQEIAELEKQLQEIWVRHTPTMAAHWAENEQASIAHGTLLNEREAREVEHLYAVGYSAVAVYDTILSQLGLTQERVQATEGVKGLRLGVQLTDLLRDFEQALRKNASTDEQREAERLAMERANKTYRKLSHSPEARELRYARLNIQLKQEELERLPVTRTKTEKTAEEMVLSNARQMIRKGFIVELFGVTAELRKA